MTTHCPANTVDENAARICAGVVVLLAAISLWPPANALMVVVAADFIIRGFGNRRYSPLRWVAKTLAGALRLETKPIYAPPKLFAAQVGAVLSTVVAGLHAAGLLVGGAHVAAYAVTGLLLAAASLEAARGFCVACWLHPFVFRGGLDEQRSPNT